MTAPCVNVEPIPDEWGGGHMCSCPAGYIHLHGPRWSQWSCPFCALAVR